MSSHSRALCATSRSSIAGLLETVLFANIRFHDTVSRGRLLNRFGKDFEGDHPDSLDAFYADPLASHRQSISGSSRAQVSVTMPLGDIQRLNRSIVVFSWVLTW